MRILTWVNLRIYVIHKEKEDSGNQTKIKIDIINFNGDVDSWGSFDWLTEVDRLFEYIEFP